MHSELGMAVVMISSYGGIFDDAVHAFNLAIGSGVVGFSQAVFDAVMPADAVEGMAAQTGGNALAIFGKIGELDVVIGKQWPEAESGGTVKQSRYWPSQKEWPRQTWKCDQWPRRDGAFFRLWITSAMSKWKQGIEASRPATEG